MAAPDIAKEYSQQIVETEHLFKVIKRSTATAWTGAVCSLAAR